MSPACALPAVLALLASACAAPSGDGAAAALPAAPRPLAAHDDEPAPAEGGRVEVPAVPVDFPALADPEPTLGQVRRLTEGADALAAGYAEAALRLFDEYLELDPDNGLGYFLRGVALLDMGRSAEAAVSLEASLRRMPDDASSHAVLARARYDLGDLEAAIEALEQASALAPDSARHRTSLGLLYLEDGRWPDAYDAFLAAVERDPTDAEAHRGLARLYTAVGELELAARAYRTALVQWPERTELHVNLGHVLRDLGQRRAALECYEQALALDPINPWIAANLGSTWLELEQPRQALPWFEQALGRLEQSGQAAPLIQSNYAMALRDVGDLDGAELFFGLALDADPELGDAHAALGMLLHDRGDRPGAREHLDAAFVQLALPPGGLVVLTELHEEAGDWDAALRSAAVLLEAPPGRDDLDYQRARLQVRSRHPEVRDPPAAIATLEGLLEGPLGQGAAGWLLLAEALAAEGRAEEALDRLEQALDKSSPRDPVTRRVVQARDRLQRDLGRDLGPER